MNEIYKGMDNAAEQINENFKKWHKSLKFLEGNMLFNSAVVTNRPKNKSYQLTHPVVVGGTYTYSMLGWTGGNDWETGFQVYSSTDGITSTGYLGLALVDRDIGLYKLTFTASQSFPCILVRNPRTVANDSDSQISWAGLVEGELAMIEHSEPGVTPIL